MLDDAIEFATKAHEGQFRKGTRRPYIVHPIEVADIVSTMTKDEEVICAAVFPSAKSKQSIKTAPPKGGAEV